MPLLNKYQATVFCFIILLISIITQSDLNAKERRILGKTIPAISLENIEGQKQSLDQWQGKLIVINFWATWCLPCLKEIPLLNQFQKEYAIDGLQIIGIAIDNKLAVKKFIKKTPILYPNLLGNAQVTLKFGNQAGLLPYTVIINQKGKIVEVASGMLTKKYLQRAIEKHL